MWHKYVICSSSSATDTNFVEDFLNGFKDFNQWENIGNGTVCKFVLLDNHIKSVLLIYLDLY